jgi:bifunctional aspartokinase / homoserine dehydrogenase 1
MLVMKFGGTSVGDANCFMQAADIVARQRARQPVVVVSAMSGVTNTLLAMARQAQDGDDCALGAPFTDLIVRHHDVVDAALLSANEKKAAAQAIDGYAAALKSILTGVCLVREATPRSRDAIAAFGEKMSSALLAAVLRDRGCSAKAVSAEELILTDDNHGQATPLMAPTRRLLNRRIPPMIERAQIPVITGFIARSTSGSTTTFSRGGSDFSASLIGAALNAEEIWIWTDVDGVMTADPRQVPQAHTLPFITYAEAAELSYFGAKVLHPKTVAPATGKGIPVWIKNTFKPDGAGTLIGARNGARNGNKSASADAAAGGSVKAITSLPAMSLVTVQGAGMIGVPGIAARVFAAVAATGASVMMISQSSSEYNICFVVSNEWQESVTAALRREFVAELKSGDVSDIFTQSVAVLAAVGEGMRGSPGVAGRLFSALGRDSINVIMIAQGSSELNISFVVEEGKRVAAVQCVHREFIG